MTAEADTATREMTVTAGGKTHRIERPFVVVATQNPIEQEGKLLRRASTEPLFIRPLVGLGWGMVVKIR